MEHFNSTIKIKIVITESIAEIVLNSPENKNALNPELLTELKWALKKINTIPSIRCIVMSSSCDVFSAGADLKHLEEINNNSFNDNLLDSISLMELFRTILNSGKITICKINGAAIAGGFGLATSCDYIFGTPNSKFAYTETKIGFIPAIVSTFVNQRISNPIARDILLSGKLLNSDEAIKLNILHELIKEAHLNDFVTDFATKIAKTTSSNSIKITKKLIQLNLNNKINEALINACFSNADCRSSNDFKKGVNSFLTKTKLEW